MRLRIDINSTGLTRKQRKLERFLKIDFLRVFKRFRLYMLRQTGLTFRALKRGGSFRGVSWPWYKNQYRRKTDGAVVPAEGGVRRVHGPGLVKGRLRPSGKRVTRSSNLLRDTGRLAAAAGQRLSFKRNGKTMVLGTGVSYADEQQARRPFLFFELPQDQDELQRLFVDELNKVMAEKSAPGGA